MAISRMQQPQQIQSGIGSLQDPRQGYFLGKLVKKAGRAVKKITKSPLGKAALLGLGGYALGGGFTGGFGSNKFGAFLKGGFGNFMKGNKGTIGGGLSNLFRTKDALGNYKGFNTGKLLLGGLGATALAAPFLMGGGDDEDEGPVDQMDPAYQTQRARNYYSGAGNAGAGLDFMPQKKYVMQNFYAADGGRAGYANGMLVNEDDEEEYIRSGAGQSRRQKQTFLSMGGGAGEAQAEQMLMMEYVKYKNKGGNLSFEQFVKAVMQAQQQPEGAGMEQPEAVSMEQPTMMAADGGPVPDSTVSGYTTPAGYNKFDYTSGGVPVRVGAQEGGIMEAEASEMIDMNGMEKDYRNEGGFVAMGGKERADDVPARLSKNEFVFTADAVRNAGGGDIDKGAEVMENLMSNLEQGGEISEESQGLEGAQAMYDQQQMLQSRVI